jgi:endonuclease-3 related protein
MAGGSNNNMEKHRTDPSQTGSDMIYRELEALKLLEEHPPCWWPNTGTFEVVIGAILTQNTSWHNVEKSLKALEGTLTLERFLNISESELKAAVRPSGYYNQKSERLRLLAKNIEESFGTFEFFQNRVTRSWLLSQKGIGPETADTILCYGCFREEMVVDSYTRRLLKSYGIVFRDYEAYKHYLETGIKRYFSDNLPYHFARFHGMIVEYGKQVSRNRKR